MTKKYTALSPLEVDGKRVEAGGTVVLNDEIAEPLLAVSAVQVSALQDEPTDPAWRQAIITSAISGLDKDHAEAWLKDGRPQSAAIAAVTGWPVSAAERDEAWAALQAAGAAEGAAPQQ